MDRYLLMTLPALLLLAAWGILTITRQLSSRWIQAVAIGLVLIFSAVALRNLYSKPDFARENWREAVAVVETNTQENDAVLVWPDQYLAFAYYTSYEATFSDLPATENEPVRDQAAEKMEDLLLLALGDNQRAWLISNFYNNDPHGFSQERNRQVDQADSATPQKAWMDERYPTIEEWFFPGIKLTLYDLEGAKEP